YVTRSTVLGVARLSLPRGGSHAALAVVVLAVAVMIVPLPTWALDLLIASNLAAALVVLFVVLHVRDAVAVATFPTLLLLSTLYRVPIIGASPRLILVQADAGRIIDSFGALVVHGSYVVGGVVFFVLTVVQLVVIVRGSERVAEVGARFVLDAMPGRQMAIDA